VLGQEGLPILRLFVEDALREMPSKSCDVLTILKILALYGNSEDCELIANAARKPIDPDSVIWSAVLNQYDEGHPDTARMIEKLRRPLPPEGFFRVAYSGKQCACEEKA